MNTSKLYLKPLALAAVIFLIAAEIAHGTAITGNVGFSGSGVGTQSGGNTLTFNNPMTVSFTVGDFGLIPAGTTTAFNPISWSGNGFSGPIIPVWSIALDGTTYSFDLTSIISSSMSSTELVMFGSGIFRISGVIQRDPTVGLWRVRGTGANFAYTLATGLPPVPEPGTVGFLFVGLAAFGVIRRRRHHP
jgi:hypothetical protein